MVTYIDDKQIKREEPLYKQALMVLNRRCEAAGITLIFDADRALLREEGGAHRLEIINAILTAKSLPTEKHPHLALEHNVLQFVRTIQTLADITLQQENGHIAACAEKSALNIEYKLAAEHNAKAAQKFEVELSALGKRALSKNNEGIKNG